MKQKNPQHAEIGGFISALLRKHFGKGPTSVYVTIHSTFFAIHIRGFLAPMEKTLLQQNERNRVLKTRDLLMRELMDQVKEKLDEIADLELDELYADWDLEKETWLLFGTLRKAVAGEAAVEWPSGVSEEAFNEEVRETSDKVEKVPGAVETHWLSSRMLIVKRTKILVALEKELVKNGLEEDLRIAKRPLERRMIEAGRFEAILNRNINEVFFDWNFDTDVGYTVFLLEAG